ncbi:hypothetical protein KKG22_02935 [Patescibacteria group bacterium]|nr:hypothetical protein [Patescibacteria group bacterium]MBU1721463.1 hypothetical protein [Patescibacteria group bacterium]MBU1900780.1 hypothetical protein [Patescibacteria group bacterium]
MDEAWPGQSVTIVGIIITILMIGVGLYIIIFSDLALDHKTFIQYIYSPEEQQFLELEKNEKEFYSQEQQKLRW